jgi:GxxExxY protein
MHVNLKYKYSDITDKIIRSAMQVHKILGNGFQEVVYQRCLAIEFDALGLKYQREVEMPIVYRDKEVGTRRVDFLIEDVVMVELKAITELDESHKAQIINYLEAFKLEIGLLINFGQKSLKWKRFIKTPK